MPRHVELQREVVRAFVPAHVQDVAKALGGDHAHLGAVTFDHDIGGHGGAMKQRVDLSGLQA